MNEKRTPPEDPDHLFDDASKLIELATKVLAAAAQAQIVENDRLGIPTHGAVGGKMHVRQAHKAKALDRR